MEIKLFVDSVQIEDMTSSNKIKKDEFMKVGDKCTCMPSINTTMREIVKSSPFKQKILKPIGKYDYEVSGKILGGFIPKFDHIFMVIDCGIPIRVCIKDPRRYREELHNKNKKISRLILIRPPKEYKKKIKFKKGDYISLKTKINAMWLDEWKDSILTNKINGTVIKREKINKNIIITVDCKPPKFPKVKYDYYRSKKSQKIGSKNVYLEY